MTALLSQSYSSIPRDNGPSDLLSDLNSLCRVSLEEFDARNIFLHRSVCCVNGDRMRVEIAITFHAGCSFDANEIEKMIGKSCRDDFEYALETSHSKTIVSGLYDAHARLAGDLVATFRPTRGLPSPIES